MAGLEFSTTFALLGMGVVFSVLILFTFGIKALSLLLRPAAGKQKASEPPRPPSAGEAAPLEQVAAAALSLYLVRAGEDGCEVALYREVDGSDREGWQRAARFCQK